MWGIVYWYKGLPEPRFYRQIAPHFFYALSGGPFAAEKVSRDSGDTFGYNAELKVLRGSIQKPNAASREKRQRSLRATMKKQLKRSEKNECKR